MTSVYNQKEIPRWHKPETGVNCPLECNCAILLKQLLGQSIVVQVLKSKGAVCSEKNKNIFFLPDYG